jgi:hypothetical protein
MTQTKQEMSSTPYFGNYFFLEVRRKKQKTDKFALVDTEQEVGIVLKDADEAERYFQALQSERGAKLCLPQFAEKLDDYEVVERHHRPGSKAQHFELAKQKRQQLRERSWVHFAGAVKSLLSLEAKLPQTKRANKALFRRVEKATK